MQYLAVSILGSTAVFEEANDEGDVRFTDADGNTVPTPAAPIHYQSRTGVETLAGWMNA